MVGVTFTVDEDINNSYSLDNPQPAVNAPQALQHPQPGPSTHQQPQSAHSSQYTRPLATSTPMTSLQPLPMQATHRFDRQHMSGLPSPPNPADTGEADPSPFAWSPPGTANRGGHPYQPLTSPDNYSYNHPFAHYGPSSAHPGNPNIAGPSTVPTLTYTNASAYGPYSSQRRSPHSTNPSSPQHHSYLPAGTEAYPHGTSGFAVDTHSPSVSPPNPSPVFEQNYTYSVYTPASLPPPPLYTSAHPHPSGVVDPGIAGPSYSHGSNTSPEIAYHPRPSTMGLSPSSRYHPYATAEKAALGASMAPASPTSKPYACRLCPYTSSRSHDLKRHMRTHTNERPYECEVCHRTFARKDAAKRHMAAKNCGANASGGGLGTTKSRTEVDGIAASGPGRAIDGASSEEQSDDEDEPTAEGDGSPTPREQVQLQVEIPKGRPGVPPKVEEKTPTPPSPMGYPAIPYPQGLQLPQAALPQPMISPTSSSLDRAMVIHRVGHPDATNPAPAGLRGAF